MLHAMSSDEHNNIVTEFTYTPVYEETQLSLFKSKKSAVRTRLHTYRVYEQLDNKNPYLRIKKYYFKRDEINWHAIINRFCWALVHLSVTNLSGRGPAKRDCVDNAD